jgi:hypothetical protein
MKVRTHSRLTITVAGVMEATMEPRNGFRGEDIVVEKGREVEVVEVGSQCGCRYILLVVGFCRGGMDFPPDHG